MWGVGAWGVGGVGGRGVGGKGRERKWRSLRAAEFVIKEKKKYDFLKKGRKED